MATISISFLLSKLGLSIFLVVIPCLRYLYSWYANRKTRNSQEEESKNGRLLNKIILIVALGGMTSGLLQVNDAKGKSDYFFWLGLFGLSLWLVQLFFLILRGIWSYWTSWVSAIAILFASGGRILPVIQAKLQEWLPALLRIEFLRPAWLWLLLGILLIIYWGWHSIRGPGSEPRFRLVLGLRILAWVLLVATLAEVRLQQPNETTAIIFVVDRSTSIPMELSAFAESNEQTGGDNAPANGNNGNDLTRNRTWNILQRWMNDVVSKRGLSHRKDASGALLFARYPRLVMPASPVERLIVPESYAGNLDPNETDIAAALKLAIASFPEGTSKRIVLISDGNENRGNALAQALIAKKNGIEIDTIPLGTSKSKHSEVYIQSVDAPPSIKEGERIPIRVIIRNTHPNRVVMGTLELLKEKGNGQQSIQIQPSRNVLDLKRSPALVQLEPGLNSFTFEDANDQSKKNSLNSNSYRATFSPISSKDADGRNIIAGLPGDRSQNNRGLAHVISHGQAQILFIHQQDKTQDHRFLIEQLRSEKFQVYSLEIERLPRDPDALSIFLSNFDLVILANIPADKITERQQEIIRANTESQGCGLIFIGGEESYGAGGYQGTAIEKALPVDCEIKSIQSLGKGGLVLIMHASEMAEGNFWQKQIAKLSATKLSRQDMIGVLDFSGLVPNWSVPFQKIGNDSNRKEIFRAIDRMTPGDMPDFDPFLVQAESTLNNPNYQLAVKHVIVISDGDPQFGPLGKSATAKMAKTGITCTTVGVATHGMAENTRMSEIAISGAKGGKFYEVRDSNQLPQIYIKETRRISQSYLYAQEFLPRLVLRDGPTEKLDVSLPILNGFVRTSMKNSPLAEMLIEGPRTFDQKFPILAAWQYGLGRAVAFTSDAASLPPDIQKWDRHWAGSEMYLRFWSQVVRWTMRSIESGKLNIFSELRDGKIRVVVELDTQSVPENTIPKITGSVMSPIRIDSEHPNIVTNESSKSILLTFVQKEKGVYEAEFSPEGIGTFVITSALKFATPFTSKNGPRFYGRTNSGPQRLIPDSTRTDEGRLQDGTKVKKNDQGIWSYADDMSPLLPFDSIEKLVETKRSAVVVSYSSEYIDLEPNISLMKQLAEATHGKMYDDRPETLERLAQSGELYRSIESGISEFQNLNYWILAIICIIWFFDIACRRIGVDRNEIIAFWKKWWQKLRQSRTKTITNDAFMTRLKSRKESVLEKLEKEVTSRRFEGPLTENLRSQSNLESDKLTPVPITPIVKPPTKPSPKPATNPTSEQQGTGQEEDYFAKLKRAKNRAPIERPSQNDNDPSPPGSS